nr:hypothetical protein [Mycolicibacillus trivialis]
MRPLTLGDIYNGAVGYIREHPKATLGLTAAVVIITQLLSLILQLGPLSAMLESESGTPDEMMRLTAGAGLAGFAAQAISGLGGLVLVGMLTVIIGRAVFGADITLGEAWERLRGRLLPLIGLVLLEAVAVIVAVFVLILVFGAIGAALGSSAAAGLLGAVIGLGALVGFVYLYVALVFAPVAIVLEQQPVIESIKRSFALVRNSFWRIAGILVLTGIVTAVVAFAIGIPFGLLGLAFGGSIGSTTGSIGSVIVAAIGGIVAQVVVQPFSCGVTVLLYTDRRIRAEAFDLVLQSGAASGQVAPGATDNLWLAR